MLSSLVILSLLGVTCHGFPPSPPKAPDTVEAVAKRAFCPEGGGDKKAGCTYWRKLGYCEPGKGYFDFMEKTCPASCGLCQPRPTPPPQAALATVNKQECLKAHNTKRALHGARPLTWDNSLARDAGKWSLLLANSNTFKHAPNSDEGENLYYISKVSASPVTCVEAVKAWYDEVVDYPFNNPPESVFQVSGAPIGHFTQIVWKDTRRLGVAIARIKRGLWYSTYIVARYSPPGNYNGEFTQQVGSIRA